MKLQIDTTLKTIKVEGEVKFEELIKVLDSMFPKSEWKSFTLTTNTIIQTFSYPIYVEKYRPSTPWWESPWICLVNNNEKGVDNAQYSLKNGVYNIEC